MQQSLIDFFNSFKLKCLSILKQRSIYILALIIFISASAFALFQSLFGAYLYKKVFLHPAQNSEDSGEILTIRKANAAVWFKENHFYSMWSIQSRDKLKLSAYFLPAKGPSDHVAILVHGESQTPEDLFELAKIYHEAFGVHVLIPALRGQSPSEGKPSIFDWNDHYDLQDWVKLAQIRLHPNISIILHGFSSGAASAIMAASSEISSSISAVISDSSFGTLENYIKSQYPKLFSGFFGRFGFYRLNQIVEHSQGFKISDISVFQSLKTCQVPILFIQGTKDSLIEQKIAFQLKASNPQNVKRFLVLFKDAAHGNSFYNNNESYQKTLSCFLEPEITPQSFFDRQFSLETQENPNFKEIESISGTQWVI